jgi:hypothetical protein
MIPMGSRLAPWGTVEWVSYAAGFAQVAVNWDIQRSLILIVPPDLFEVVYEERE